MRQNGQRAWMILGTASTWLQVELPDGTQRLNDLGPLTYEQVKRFCDDRGIPLLRVRQAEVKGKCSQLV